MFFFFLRLVRCFTEVRVFFFSPVPLPSHYSLSSHLIFFLYRSQAVVHRDSFFIGWQFFFFSNIEERAFCLVAYDTLKGAQHTFVSVCIFRFKKKKVKTTNTAE